MYDSGDIVTIWQLVNVAQDDNPTDEQVLRRPENLCAWTIWRVACSTQLANDFLRFERRDSESISNLSPSFKNRFPYLFRMSFKSSRYERSCRQPAILSRKRKAEKEIMHSRASPFSAAIVGNSSGTRLLEGSPGDSSVLPEPLQLSFRATRKEVTSTTDQHYKGALFRDTRQLRLGFKGISKMFLVNWTMGVKGCTSWMKCPEFH
ncbi:hypothetical protein TNCV_3302691 [Trichonephila clavipes]|nr:hypothetical protein TNCV_3302691 [Trichonephila clavipes]